MNTITRRLVGALAAGLMAASAEAEPAPVNWQDLAPVVLDGENVFALDPSLAEAAEAVLNIRSVYDVDGVAILDIAATADPALTLAVDRPRRFLRIEKAVSIPDDDIVDLENTDFGVSTLQGMREIVGYAMIEPDGSVMTKVPANVALMISVLDADGKRITARHQNWIQLKPGQELKCNGCTGRSARIPEHRPAVVHRRARRNDGGSAGSGDLYL